MTEKAIIRTDINPVILKQNKRLKLNAYEKSVLQWAIFDGYEHIMSIYNNNPDFIMSLPSNEFVYAVIKEKNLLKTLRNKCNLANISYSINNEFNFENEFFNTIILSEPIYKTENLNKLLKESLRVLKNLGQIVLCNTFAPFNSQSILNKFCNDEYGFSYKKFLSKEEIYQQLETAGFKNIEFHIEYGFILVCTAWKI